MYRNMENIDSLKYIEDASTFLFSRVNCYECVPVAFSRVCVYKFYNREDICKIFVNNIVLRQ